MDDSTVGYCKGAAAAIKPRKANIIIVAPLECSDVNTYSTSRFLVYIKKFDIFLS